LNIGSISAPTNSRREAAVGQSEDEFVLRAEVVIDRREIDPGQHGDIAQGHAVESAGGVNAFRRTEDAFTGILGGLFGHTDV
jgi:hypothetical protein